MAKSYDIYERDWVEVPSHVRAKIVEIFELPRSGNTYCIDNDIISDGHTDEDLSEITIEKLQNVMKSKSENFDEMFDAMVEIISNNNKLPYEQVKGTDIGGDEITTESKKSAKKNK